MSSFWYYEKEREKIEQAVEFASRIIYQYNLSLHSSLDRHPIPVDGIFESGVVPVSPFGVTYVYLQPEAVYCIEGGRAGVAIGWVMRKQLFPETLYSTYEYAACLPFVSYIIHKKQPFPLTEANLFACLCYLDILNYVEPRRVTFSTDKIKISATEDSELECDLRRGGELISEAEWDRFRRLVRSIKFYETIK